MARSANSGPNSSAGVSGRAQVSKLARSDIKAAYAVAQLIDDPWYAAQAFATVARFADGALRPQAFSAARTAASNGKDGYQQAAVLAWPLRAAIETGELKLAEQILRDATGLLSAIDSFSSRAQAFDLLFQAAFPAGTRFWRPLLDKLAPLLPPDSHWRAARLRRILICLLADTHANVARQIVAELPPGRLRRTCERELADGVKGLPRSFFL